MPSTFLPVQVVPPLGLEPRTRGLKVRCSNHLSYGGSPSVAMLPSSCEATRDIRRPILGPLPQRVSIPTPKRQPVLQSWHELFRLAMAMAALERITLTVSNITPSQSRLGDPQRRQ